MGETVASGGRDFGDIELFSEEQKEQWRLTSNITPERKKIIEEEEAKRKEEERRRKATLEELKKDDPFGIADLEFELRQKLEEEKKPGAKELLENEALFQEHFRLEIAKDPSRRGIAALRKQLEERALQEQDPEFLKAEKDRLIEEKKKRVTEILVKNLDRQKEALAAIPGETADFEAKLEEELKLRLAEVEEFSEMAGGKTAEFFAEKGLGRSTFARRSLGEVALAEQREKARLYGQTAQTAKEARKISEDVKLQEQAVTAQVLLDLENEDIAGLTRERQYIDEQQIKERFLTAFERMALASERKQTYAGFLGSIAGEIVKGLF